MAGNTFGHVFRLSTFGESHGPALGGVIDGCPSGLALDQEAIRHEMNRRKPGQSNIVTQRKEGDEVRFLSGIFEGKTTGAPIGFIIENQNQKPGDYDHLRSTWRPSHADYTWEAKFGLRDHRGGGRASARETASRVVGGAVARQVLAQQGIKIWSYVSSVGELQCAQSAEEVNAALIDSNTVRCPHPESAARMIELIRTVRKAGDTIGGTITCVAEGVPAGLGEPVFDKLHADLGKAMLSINAAKGIEFGSGFEGTEMQGTQHNDLFVKEANKLRTLTNHSGGIQGGISNGENIVFKVAFKPVATIMQPQAGVDKDGQPTTVKGKGRHDPCVLPRAVPIVDAMAAITLLDHWLRNKTSKL